MPTAVLPGGIYYSQDLFEQAGITGQPDRPRGARGRHGGAQGRGRRAHRARRARTPGRPRTGTTSSRCASAPRTRWPTSPSRSTSPTTAGSAPGEDLQSFADTEPFNEGFLTTTAQQGAGSSAGLIANHQAAMELMGAWNPGVIASLTPDQKPLADLGWFPFPAVEGGEGDPAAMMGGVDGYSCYVDAPQECADFLNFFMQKEYQEGYAEAFVTLPASQEAQGVVTDPALQDILDGLQRGAVRHGLAGHPVRPERRQRAQRRCRRDARRRRRPRGHRHRPQRRRGARVVAPIMTDSSRGSSLAVADDRPGVAGRPGTAPTRRRPRPSGRGEAVARTGASDSRSRSSPVRPSCCSSRSSSSRW